jgi:lipid-binding SYLF domain-containing protein
MSRTPRESKVDQVRQAAASLNALDYLLTAVLVTVFAIGTSLDEGPKTDMNFYRSAATVIPTLLIAVAIQGRVLELARHVTFRRRYRTVLLAIVVFGGEAGALMTIGRNETNWAAHLYVYLALMSLGIALLYLALVGPDRFTESDEPED